MLQLVQLPPSFRQSGFSFRSTVLIPCRLASVTFSHVPTNHPGYSTDTELKLYFLAIFLFNVLYNHQGRHVWESRLLPGKSKTIFTLYQSLLGKKGGGRRGNSASGLKFRIVPSKYQGCQIGFNGEKIGLRKELLNPFTKDSVCGKEVDSASHRTYPNTTSLKVSGTKGEGSPPQLMRSKR